MCTSLRKKIKISKLLGSDKFTFSIIPILMLYLRYPWWHFKFCMSHFILNIETVKKKTTLMKTLFSLGDMISNRNLCMHTRMHACTRTHTNIHISVSVNIIHYMFQKNLWKDVRNEVWLQITYNLWVRV